MKSKSTGTPANIRQMATAFVVHLVALTAVFVLLAPFQTYAMSRTLSFKELVSRAETIVLADVSAVTTRLDTASQPTTDVYLDVVHTIFGRPVDRITVNVPGGRIRKRVLHVTGTPSFGEGERVIVFLDPSKRVVGGFQGRLGVHGNRVLDTGETLARFQERVLAARYGVSARLSRPESESESIATLSAETPTVSALADPAISAVSPSAVPAGTGATVKLAGSGFGTTTGTVEFTHGAIVVRANRIVSWSDTLIEVEVPVSVSSGPVFVRTANGMRSSGATLTITYSLSRTSWTRSSIPFRISSAVPADRQAYIRDGAHAWDGIANFAFSYAGSTSTARSGNGVNEVWWGDTGIAGALAVARVSYYELDTNADGFFDMIEADIIFSSSESAWGDGTSNTFDVRSVAAHEFGHWLSLGDLYGPADSHKVMYGLIAPGQLRRTPAAEDRAGIIAIYGPPAVTEPDIELVRIWGADRYRTALEISRQTFAAGSVPTVVLATGRRFADALSASGLAGAYQSPLLLTSGSTLESFVVDEIRRLGAKRVVIVGGTAAISQAVEDRLRRESLAVQRIDGADRYATAAAVARAIAVVTGSSFGKQVFLARGDDFADALAAAPLAYARKTPVLLTRPDVLPEAAATSIRDIQVSSAVVVGGEKAISSTVTTALDKIGVTWIRVSGDNRYATARALVQHAVAHRWVVPDVIGITTGENFPDALGGGAAAGAKGGVILLTKSKTLPVDTESLLRDHTEDLARVEVYGGAEAVCDTVVNAIRNLWK